MDTIEVVRVIRYKENIKQLIGFYIDTPRQNTTLTDTYTINISGWTSNISNPVIAVWFTHDKVNPEVLMTTQPILPRPDVLKIHRTVETENCGFSVIFSVLGLPHDIELNIQLILADHTRILAGTIYLRRLTTISCTYQPTMNPLMVTSLGRSGSTWLMRLLAEHPEIIIHRIYPYEAYHIKYWIRNIFRILSEPINYLSANSFDKLFNLNIDWANHHLYHNPELQPWFNHTYIQQAADFCCQAIDSVYTQLAKNQAEYHNNQPHYFAEKFGPSHVNLLLNELCPNTREIILVRDFRDMLCSSIAFSQKIGVSDFGLENTSNEAEIVAATQHRAQSLLTYWQQRKNQAYLLHYEDLVLKPVETLSKLLIYLGLTADNITIETLLARAAKNQTETQTHATTSSPANSIGRWQRDLPQTLQTACQQQLQTELTAFGYTI